MPLYLGGGPRPTSSPTQGPLVDSVRQMTFTDSRGQTSGYSVWADHIDPDEPVGLLVHLHGDGGYEYKNDPNTWYLTGPSGILTLARERNMILVIPFTPDREIGEINAETWWEDIVPHVGWAMELTQEILDTYSVDLARVWFSGFSGGADAISHQIIPHHLAELGAQAGGFVILGGGGSPYQVTQTVLSSPLKARFPITWVVGENDRPEHAYDAYDGRGAAEAGEATYRAYGWATDIVIVPGMQHLLVEGSQGLYGHYIGEAMDSAPAISYDHGAVLEMYLGDRRCDLYLGPDLVTPPPVVKITLGTGNEAQVQLRAALTARGLDYNTVTEIPFGIELVGTGSAQFMFDGYWALESVPDMDTSQVTNMEYMFLNCTSLTTVPEMDTSGVTNMSGRFMSCSALTYVPDLDTSSVMGATWMFYFCSSLADGNVRLIGKHPSVDTEGMIYDSGLTREPFFDAAGNPLPPPEEVHQVSLTDVSGEGTVHPLVSVTVPAGEVWDVEIQGTVTKAPGYDPYNPAFRIGSSTSARMPQGATVNFPGTVSSSNATIAMVTNMTLFSPASFTGTVTIRK